MPVVDHTSTLFELIEKDSSALRASNDPASLGLIYYEDNKPLNPVLVDDKLVMNPLGVGTAVKTGTITINNPDPIVSNISVSKIVPAAAGVDSIIFPPVNNLAVTQNLPKINQFSYAKFESGTFQFKFTNNNGSDIVINSIKFINLYNAQVIPQMQSTAPLTIATGSTKQTDFNLAGATLVDSMRIELVVSAPGSGFNFVKLPPNAGTSVEGRILNFTVEEVNAVLPPQDPITIDSTFALDDSTQLSEIVIKDGSLVFEVKNHLDVDLSAVFVFKNLRDPSNNPYTANFVLPRKSNDIKTISSLLDYRIVSLVSGQLTNKLGYTVTLTPKSSSGTRTLRKDDSISVNINMSDLVLKSIDGRIKPTALEFNATSIPVKLGSMSNFNAASLKFKEFLMELFINSTSTEELGFKGKIRGKNNNVTSVINIPYTSIIGGSSATHITLSSAELTNFIDAFASAPPDSVTFEYSAIVSPNYLVGKITNTDSIFGTGHLYTPLKLGMSNGRFVDTSEVNIASSNQEQLSSLQNASLNLIVENHLPISINFQAVLLDEFGDTTVILPPRYAPNTDTVIVIPGGIVSASTGRVTQPAVDSISISLKGEEFTKFSRSKTFRSYITMNTSLAGNAPVSFYTSDYIKIRGFGLVKYRVKP